jgi:hypothetical protein
MSMPLADTVQHCKHCNAQVKGSLWMLRKHVIAVHPEKFRGRLPGAKDESTTATDMFHHGQELIKKALKAVDTERDALMIKVRELDDLAAKYRKVINPNA